ncbi:hypothetical protein D3C86_1137760 [compost metagenome]
MGGIGDILAQRLPDPARLQPVLLVKGQPRRPGECYGRHAIREMAGHEIRAGGGVIAEHAERRYPAALHRLGVGGHGGKHPARAQPFHRMILIVHCDVDEIIAAAGES